MRDIGELKELVHRDGITQRDQLLLILESQDLAPKSVKQVKQLALELGLRWIGRANVSDRLSKTNGGAIKTPAGWELSPRARTDLEKRYPSSPSRTLQPATDLRAHIAKLTKPDVAAFLEEAIACCEQKLWRAAVVLSWCGAVAVLHEHVAMSHLATFNAEAKRRDAKWRDAKTTDDLGRMKEHDFLDILSALSIMGKNVKKELQDNCLALRNACGHPNSFVLAEARVAAHLEMLILNVFARF